MKTKKNSGIEITDEMIEAGKVAFYAWEDDSNGGVSSCVQRVFKAMEACHEKGK